MQFWNTLLKQLKQKYETVFCVVNRMWICVTQLRLFTLNKLSWTIFCCLCMMYECVRHRPLRDPGIFSKSRSRDSQKYNPGIFRDFQKPLNNCILRLSTPFIDHNNLFWYLWTMQEGQKTFFKLLIFHQPIINMD